MFCYRCGKEINEGSKFCCYCGAQVQANDAKVSTKGKKKKSPVVIGSMACILILAGVLVTGIKFWMNEKVATGANQEETVEIEKEAGEVTEEGTQIEEEPYQLLVCVPAEYMSLRSTPGLGDDEIAQLTAGTYLKWYGERVTEEDTEFYKVVVRDNGMEGYVSASFCVEVSFEPDESVLDIVETDTIIYTYEMMAEDVEKLCGEYPDRLTYKVIGTSWDGRDIYEVVLGNPDAENHIMAQAAIHGREYMTAQLVMKMLEYYAYYYESAEYEQITYKELFENTAIHVVPMANPDGVTISQLGVTALNDDYYADLVYECYERDKGTLAYEEDSNGDMNWSDYYRQKGYNREVAGHEREITFEEYQTIWKANACGVDLNNNFDAGWEDIDLKKEPAYGSFKGYFAVSEPESRALVDLAYQYDYKYFISYHSRGQLIYYDVTGNTPENSKKSENLANLLYEQIKYKPVDTQDAYNVNLGGFGDWVQLYLNKPSVTIESGKGPCPLEAGEFSGMWYRHRESWAMLAQDLYN